MKISNLTITLFIAAIFFTACQKSYDINPDGESIGTLKDTTSGACLPVTVNGIFRVDSVLTNDNYVDVEVNVTVGGRFDIKSDSVNGYSFKKTGTVGTGLNRIRLYASGKPTATGTNIFTIKYGLKSCTFSITVFNSGTGTALYTLGGSPGNCSITSITGNYITGVPMAAANRVQATVNVTSIGTYTITGTVINGVSFNASGVFVNPGIQSIFLAATGTPVAAGTFSYPINNAATICNLSITYTSVITNASFALSGSPGNCTGAVVNGTYTAGTALTATNTATINVNVTSTGNYSITTTTVNGISFSKTGTFNITGPQQIILVGTGTPTTSGTFNFPVSGGGTTCIISVICGGGTPPVGNLDYVPETSFSNWSDKLKGGTAADTSYTQVSANTILIAGKTYKIFEVKDMGMPVDSFYHRKNGGMYYQLYEGDYGIFDNSFSVDGLILDSSKAVNYAWTILLGPNTVGGLPVNVKIDCQILAKNATATVSGSNYTQIIKVKYSYKGDLGLGYTLFADEERWYAKGFGLIYDKITEVQTSTTTELETTRIQIF